MLTISQLTQLRKNLHQYPELSKQERETAERIMRQFEHFHPDEVHRNLGGHGLAFVFQGSLPGPSTLIRCELDALPIEEINDFAHRKVRRRHDRAFSGNTCYLVALNRHRLTSHNHV